MKHSIYIVLVLVLLFSFTALIGSASVPSGPGIESLPSTAPSSFAPTQNSTIPSQITQPTVTPTTQPPTVQPTLPTAANPTTGDYIGTLYTRSHLESLDNTLHGYGCGRNYNTTRPHIPIDCQAQSGGYNAAFIGEDIPKIYLTFDCGYEFGNLTSKILDTLQEKNVKAVFFVTMHYCKTQPQLVQRMIDEGHIVGNHSSNHRSMPTLSLDEMVYEIMSLHEYVRSNFGYEMSLFRPPKGEYSARSLAVAQSLGYQSVFWSFAYQDWNTDAQPSTQAAFDTVSGCAHNGCIYLLHAVSSANAAILGDVIDDLRSRGYSLELYR